MKYYLLTLKSNKFDFFWSRELGAICVAISCVLSLSMTAIAQTSQLPDSSDTTPITTSPRPLLQIGSEGEEVVNVQAMLTLLGFYTGAIDGEFDESTATAVMKFQEASELVTDGIVGENTWNSLLPSISRVTAQSSSPVTP